MGQIQPPTTVDDRSRPPSPFGEDDPHAKFSQFLLHLNPAQVREFLAAAKGKCPLPPPSHISAQQGVSSAPVASTSHIPSTVADPTPLHSQAIHFSEPSYILAREDMASRGRRGVHAREGEQRRDEPRREDQGEQQAPAPQGPVLPPPPPVDYVVFMQGLVQAMQTLAHTQAALQAQLEAQAHVPVPQAQDHGGPSIMERFKRMSPPSFKGESDPLLAESWMREIEKIFRAIRCAEDDKVILATYMLQE
ncbi:hypothetical protein Taro_034840 [Colocasia esculenta]|uniref:Uncharacterized protein n=1 Tax=Colocasia esculenta TaxID=4460 RepID=A0A843WGR4_COLES|nr:hypothetical protein [Colocasia esculenta]